MASDRRPPLLLALCLTTACYTYAPAAGPPVPGQQVRLDLSDAGRLALAPGVGSGAERVEGEVASRSDSLLTLRVSSVRYAGGASARWTGEPLALRPADVARTGERRFSRGRTLALAGLGAGGLLALALTQDLSLFGTPGRDDTPVGGGPGQ